MQTANKLRRDVVGIDFDGHFARIAGETFRYGIENVLNVGKWESGRSSAPNVYRVYRIGTVNTAQSVEFGATQVHFLYQGRSIIVLQSEQSGAIEAAIDATALAKRYVDVYSSLHLSI